MLGTFILWFGWYGFNAGSAIPAGGNTGAVGALAAVTTTLSAASAGVTALFTNLWIAERRTGEAHFDILVLMNGCLGGLVAITAGCAVVEPWAAVVIGTIAGWTYLGSSELLLKLRIDDAVDAIPVHLGNGLWGVIAVGFFAAPGPMKAAYGTDVAVGWFYSLARGSFDARLLACQVCGILFIIGWVFFMLFPFFIWLNYLGWFRADSLEELVGLDISYHGGMTDGAEDIKLEYVEAFNRKRGRKPEGPPTDAMVEPGVPYGETYADEGNYNPDGYDAGEYDPNGYDPNGGYDTNNGYDPNGYDSGEYDPNAYDPNGYAPTLPSGGRGYDDGRY
jgi:hypothetical protein